MSAETDQKEIEIGIEPIGPRFIGVKVEAEDVTPGGIHLPTRAQDKQQNLQPEVLVVRISKALEAEYKDKLKKGTRVLLNNTSMLQQFKYKTKEYVMIDVAQIKGIYED